jgi:hypothetical protein
LPTTELRGLVVVGHGVLEYLMLRMVMLLRRLMGPDVMLLVKGSKTLSGAVLDILDIGNEMPFLGMGVWMSIVDIRIVALLLARSKSRHAWIPPQRAAFAERRGQSNYVLDHCWVVLCFWQPVVAVRLFVFDFVETLCVSDALYIML